jgi:hypothetical protein
MRDRSNTVSRTANVARSVDVSVMSKPTMPTPKHLLMPLSLLYPSARRAGQARVSRTDQSNRETDQGSQQQHTSCEVSSGVTFPSDQSLRVFQGNASARSVSHGHQLSGFAGEHLSLGTCFNLTVDASFLVHRAPVLLSFQDGPQVWPFVAITARHRSTDSNIAAYPAGDGPDFWQRYVYAHSGIPLPVLTKDFSAAFGTEIQLCTRHGQCAVQSSVTPGWYVQLLFGAFDENPVVKAGGFLWQLQIGTINQLCPQVWGDKGSSGHTGSFLRPPPVNKGTAIGSSRKLSHALTARASGLLTQRCCARSMMPRKESRQKMQGVCFVASRKEFQLVTENCVHPKKIAKCEELHNPARTVQTPERASLPSRTDRRDCALPVLWSGACPRIMRPPRKGKPMQEAMNQLLTSLETVTEKVAARLSQAPPPLRKQSGPRKPRKPRKQRRLAIEFAQIRYPHVRARVQTIARTNPYRAMRLVISALRRGGVPESKIQHFADAALAVRDSYDALMALIHRTVNAG